MEAVAPARSFLYAAEHGEEEEEKQLPGTPVSSVDYAGGTLEIAAAAAREDEGDVRFGEISAERSQAGGPEYSLALFQQRLATAVQESLAAAGNRDVPLPVPQLASVLEDLFINLITRVASRLPAQLPEVERDARYFELLASFLSSDAGHDAAVQLQQYCSQLWSHALFPPIYCLLFYEWLFAALRPTERPDRVNRYFVVVRGANRLFWLDVVEHRRRFAVLFRFFQDRLLLNYQLLKEFPERVRKSIELMVWRYALHYGTEVELGATMRRCLEMWVPSGAPLAARERVLEQMCDDFVVQVTRQLRHVESAGALANYLRRLARCRGLLLSPEAANRLQSTLSDLTTPGGPLFPPREVRMAAKDALDTLFPHGQWPRRVVRFAFSLLHPYYWPPSLVHFGATQVARAGRAGSAVLHAVPCGDRLARVASSACSTSRKLLAATLVQRLRIEDHDKRD